jgi:hypothetical protein
MVRAIAVALVAASLAACASSNGTGAEDGAVTDGNTADSAVDATPPDAPPDAPIDAPVDACVPDPDGETCNGENDDCDEGIDEGYPGVGEACSVGVGGCFREGVTVCTGDGAGVECSVVPADPIEELCGNAVDDDCDAATDEGFDVGVSCTVGLGVCTAAGIKICGPGGVGTVCSATPGTGGDESCNSIDDDCDGDVDEDFNVGSACDGADGDLCQEGVRTCDGGGGAICTDTSGTLLDVCNGVDDDCDPFSEDGSEDDLVGDLCDGPDTDLCGEGVRHCTGGELLCSDSSGSTVDTCNGADDDCDPNCPDGSEDVQIGMACDGQDSDLCIEGALLCSGGGLACSDASGSTLDLCNGVDDDCDPGSADGTEDGAVGVLCDGADGDLCAEGLRFCSGGGLQCNDNTGNLLDVCDGTNNDCFASSPDGSEDPGLGAACDGTDTDLCTEGTRICSGGGLQCNDNTGSTVDVCNGTNDDCDGSSPDGSEDPLLGTSCDGNDGDACLEGTRSCSSGALQCSDNTGTINEACNALDDDCDGIPDDGIVRDDNPLCSTGTFYLGGVSGDTGAGILNDSWQDEEWDRFTMSEDDSDLFSSVYLSATINLTSAPGTDFDLYVYCNNCTGGLAGSSTLGSGQVDTVRVRTNDDSFSWDDMDVVIEVRHWSSSVCAPWTLQVIGNTAVSTETCN